MMGAKKQKKSKKTCCDKYKYMMLGKFSAMSGGLGIKIILRRVEERNECNIKFCPECGDKLELYWETGDGKVFEE